MASTESKLRILCFGDSLTSGYSALGAIHHPYEEALASILNSGLPRIQIETLEDGKDGDLVSSDMRGGFLTRIKRHFGPKSRFDWTVILGGTNDLGFALEPDRIFKHLKEVYNVPLSHGSKVIACTVPEDGSKIKALHERLAVHRNKLNALIRQYAKETSNVYVCELHSHVQWSTMSEADRSRYMDDAIHFTPDGYDLIGQKIGQTILAAIAKEKAEQVEVSAATTAPETHDGSSGAVKLPQDGQTINDELSAAEETKRKAIALAMNTQLTPPKRRRMKGFKDDDKVFEEEEGPPNELESGYIVVRKKDLFDL